MKHKTAYQKAVENIRVESRKQCFLAYGAAGITLWRYWDKGTIAILRLFEKTMKVWNECANDPERGMLEICEDETGIEIQCGDGKSWRDLPYLSKRVNSKRFTNAQWVYMRQQQIKWIPAQVIACILIALHRKWKFGFDRCQRFYGQVQEVQAEFNNDPDKMRLVCIETTGVDINDILTERRSNHGKDHCSNGT